MFNYDETDLFFRCGYSQERINNKKTYFTGRYLTLSDGTTIPIMHYPIISEGLAKHLVLKTYLGYIPIENINKFTDIFNIENYLDDDTEWISPYLYQHPINYEDQVKRLSIILGKHWKAHNDKEIIKPKKRSLTKTKIE